MKRISAFFIGAILLFGVTSCDNPKAEVASENLSTAADNFELNRRIVFVNGITDEYLLSIEGFCSIHVDVAESQLEVTCKVGENQYKKHFLGMSDNITYFVEQLESANVSVDHYRVIFRPSTIVPDVELG